MDADMVCHTPITVQRIAEFFPDAKQLCYAGRSNKFTECGLYGMHLREESVQKFLTEFQRMYDDAENGIFTLPDWHDSWGAYIDHLKGKRKGDGRSKLKDLVVRRTEQYWQ
jgi:hypothetical protein